MIKFMLGVFIAIIALSLLGLNLYGEVRTMRVVDSVPLSEFKFKNDITLDADEALKQIKRNKDETDLEFSLRITTVIQQSLGHLDTWFTAHPDRYAQRIPPWENLWLFLAGHLSREPQVVKYHFADYRKTLERGVAICGDHAKMLSAILWENDIPNSILVFEKHIDYWEHGGHVVVEVRPENDVPHLLDADFGVVMPYESTDAGARKTVVYSQFKKAGYSTDESKMLSEIMAGEYTVYKSTWDIMKKRYILEKSTYAIKWLLPLMLLAVSIYLLRRRPMIMLSGSYFNAT